MSIPTMDAIISYEDFMKMLENQPSLLPRPNCMRLRAWGKYNADILAQIPHPNYPQPTARMEGDGITTSPIRPHQ